MTTAISAASDGIIIISIEYDPTGLAWARLYDSYAVGWLIDETTLVPTKPAPPDVTGAHAPFPLIIGSLPSVAPDTTPIVSPQWAKLVGQMVFIPDLWRGALPDFFTQLATKLWAAIAGGLISTDWATRRDDMATGLAVGGRRQLAAAVGCLDGSKDLVLGIIEGPTPLVILRVVENRLTGADKRARSIRWADGGVRNSPPNRAVPGHVALRDLRLSQQGEAH
jgi:hypothetical protein